MIVSVTRGDLRDEFMMADEAFALSPISARAAQPREEDYDAIRDAFMETSRGRWFLGEYAKRNRNADTRMVLDAVARIEETIAAQKQPVPDNELPDALAAIRGALDEAKAVASAALDGLALEENLAPVRKGARVIKEIAWRWREIGADTRICDLIDSQVGAIEAGCGRITSDGPRGALSAAFDLIEARIAAFDDSDAAPTVAEETPPSPSPAPPDEIFAAAATPATSMGDVAETGMRAVAMPAEETVATAEAAKASAATADVTAIASEASSETTDMSAVVLEAPAEAIDVVAEASDAPADELHATPADADAHDEAVLEMVALEMAAADPDQADDISGTEDVSEVDPPGIQPADIRPVEVQTAERPSAEPEIAARAPEPVAAAVEPESVPTSLLASLRPSAEAVSAEAASAEAVEPSLGSSLLASGLLRRPRPSSSDPLAPIRRMSQAEKIAFFS
jgi:hypothetical protein